MQHSFLHSLEVTESKSGNQRATGSPSKTNLHRSLEKFPELIRGDFILELYPMDVDQDQQTSSQPTVLLPGHEYLRNITGEVTIPKLTKYQEETKCLTLKINTKRGN